MESQAACAVTALTVSWVKGVVSGLPETTQERILVNVFSPVVSVVPFVAGITSGLAGRDGRGILFPLLASYCLKTKMVPHIYCRRKPVIT